MLQGQEDFIHVVSAELVEAERLEHSRGPQAHGESWEMLGGRQTAGRWGGAGQGWRLQTKFCPPEGRSPLRL